MWVESGRSFLAGKVIGRRRQFATGYMQMQAFRGNYQMPELGRLPRPIVFSQLPDPLGRMNLKIGPATTPRKADLRNNCIILRDAAKLHVLVKNLKCEYILKDDNGAGILFAYARLVREPNGGDKALLTALPA